MPGLQGDTVVAALGSPVRKNKLSLKFLQKKETKRVLDFSEPQADEAKSAEPEHVEPEASSCDQVVPGPTLSCDKKDNLVPFVGLNNLGNTCYLNSVLQVLYYCPGLREGIKQLYNVSKRREKTKEETDNGEEPSAAGEAEELPAQLELVGSLHSLISSLEQLQSSFLLSPDSFSEGELATPPRKILHTLRQLNPMYEGYLQHDAQEVLQCILGYIQEACQSIRKEQQLDQVKEEEQEGEEKSAVRSGADGQTTTTEEDAQLSGKRKSDTEVGNAKKKPKSVKEKAKKSDSDKDAVKTNGPLTRAKRKSSGDITVDNNQAKSGHKGEDDEEEKEDADKEEEAEKESKEAEGKRKKKRLGWLRPSGKQPSIFSKFRSMGKLSSMTARHHGKETEEEGQTETDKDREEKSTQQSKKEDKKTVKHQEGLDLMERLFQGQLVLRTRCLECESFTERREDFQDISVPVLDEQPASPEELAEVSPDPKPELKTLKWAIGQFASVERIVGEDKYFCETCHHYTEAERSLLFDKTPEVITIHLKRFSANGLEMDPYAGLSKVNTPLQTPLTLCLDEWCTRPSAASGGQHYQLLAVVMHSGVTISSGHYTAYVRMSGLKDATLSPPHTGGGGGDKEDKDIKEDKSAKDEQADYDDGEVSFSVKRGAASSSSGKAGGKKGSEGGGVVGLLGGQRSLSSYEMEKSSSSSSKQSKEEGSKRRKTVSVSQSAESGDKRAAAEASEQQQALNNLMEFEGKWLLFDDSEVRLFEEEEFLRACSPDMCSASTPYLLFYRRIPAPE